MHLIQSPPVITIDGPSGSGKGTISAKLADFFGWHLLDSGALYRGLAYYLLQNNLTTATEEVISFHANSFPLHFASSEDFSGHKKIQILLNDEDISQAIRNENCGKIASEISALALVRKALIEKQHDFRKSPGLIADGRDMGTIIFPDAPLKIFLDATLEERAKRRFMQLQQAGKNVIFEDVLKDLHARDKRDKDRTIAPLKPASDAYVIDSSFLSIDEVFNQIISLAAQKGIR